MQQWSPLSLRPQTTAAANRARPQPLTAGVDPAELAPGLESLESRTLMSVTMSADGWTNVTPSSDSHIIYVSSSTGNDSNSGLSADQAVKSIAKGESLLRNNMPDELLFKRGDTWTGQTFGRWTLSGRSASEPMVVGAYGDPNAARPLFKTGSSDGIDTGGANLVSNVDFIGLQFYADARDPSSPTFSSGAAGTDSSAVRWLNGASNLLFEDDSFRFYGDNLIFQAYAGPISNITLRRSEILDSYNSNGAHSQGVYVEGVTGFLAEGNVFDHNGWNNSVGGAEATIFNHDLYIQTGVRGMVLKDNIISRGAATGAQARPGGTVTGNLFLYNPTAVFMMDEAGVGRGTLSNNTILDGNDITSSLPRGWGINIGNVLSAGMDVTNNVIAHEAAAGSGAPAIDIDGNNGSGVTNTTVTGNLIYDWPGGISSHGTVTNTTVSGNITSGNFTDPNRDAATYQGTQGGPATFDAFIAAARAQSRNTWNSAYTAATVSAYIRAGFNLGSPTPPPAADTTAPTATLNPIAAITAAGGASTTFTVAYVDNVAVNTSTLNSSDLLVTGPNGFNQLAALVSVDNTANGTPRTATYRVTAPAGGWSNAANGTYTIAAQASQVADTSGNTLAAKTLGTFTVNISAPTPVDTTAPTATLNAIPPIAAGAASATFTVTFADNVAINNASLNSNDLLVTGPNGFSQLATFVSVDNAANGTPRTATYRVNAPTGGWTSATNGTYTIAAQASQVSDTSGNALAAGALGSFTLNLPAPPPPSTVDTTAPTAKLLPVSPVTTAGGTTQSFQVTFSDNVAVNIRSINEWAFAITGPNGFNVMPTSWAWDNATNGTPRTCTLTFAAPGGAWDRADNGTYTISLTSQHVKDTSGNYAAGATLGTFAVNIPLPDTTAPTAKLNPVPAITTAGGTTQSFQVTFSDNVGINTRSVNEWAFAITGPNGFNVMPTSWAWDNATNGTPRTCTLTFAAPGGTWDRADNGTYTISLTSQHVKDTSGNYAAGATLGTFTVNIA